MSATFSLLEEMVDGTKADWAAAITKLLAGAKSYAMAQGQEDKDRHLVSIVHEAIRVHQDEQQWATALGLSLRDEWLADYSVRARAVYQAAMSLAEAFRNDMRSVTETVQVLNQLATKHKFLDVARQYAAG